MNLLPIAEEADACRAAWAAEPGATFGWHIHHEQLAEVVTESIEERITYDLHYKPQEEQALRLRLMRPVTGAAGIHSAAWRILQEAITAATLVYEKAVAPAWVAYKEGVISASSWSIYVETALAARRAYAEAIAPARRAYDESLASSHAEQCPDCPWDGKSIFGGAK